LQSANAWRERRRRKRKSVLSELGELVVVTLGAERGLLLDLSSGGIAVQTQNPLMPGANLAAQFPLPLTEASINPTCETVWTNQDCQVGLKFRHLGEGEKLALENWLTLHGAEPGDLLTDALPADAGWTPACRLMDDREESHAPPDPIAGDEMPASLESAAPEDLLQQIVTQACSLTNADGAALVLRSEEGVVCRASTGSAPAVGSRLRPGSGLSGECFRLGQVVRCDDTQNDPLVNAAVAQRLQLRSILIVPVQVEGSIRGVLQVLSLRPFAFDAGITPTLENLAVLVGSFLAAEENVEVAAPAESEVVETPAEQPTQGNCDNEVAEDAHSAEAEQHPDNPPIIDEKTESGSKLRRNAALVGLLGLVAAASLFSLVVRTSQPIRPAETLASPQQQQQSILPPAQERADKSQRPIRESVPLRAVPARHHQDAGKHSPRTEQRVHTSAVAIRTPAGKSDSEPATAAAAVSPSSSEAASDAVIRGQPISQPKPVYPLEALNAGVEGLVVLEATIGTDGAIKKLAIVKGDPLLAGAAQDAVKKWRYQPSYLNGAPVEVESTITVSFKLP